jgi:hypothetical protein
VYGLHSFESNKNSSVERGGTGESVKNYGKCNPGATIGQAIQAINPNAGYMISGSKHVFEEREYHFRFTNNPTNITREMILAKQAELNAICSEDPTTRKYERTCEEGEVPAMMRLFVGGSLVCGACFSCEMVTTND